MKEKVLPNAINNLIPMKTFFCDERIREVIKLNLNFFNSKTVFLKRKSRNFGTNDQVVC